VGQLSAGLILGLPGIRELVFSGSTLPVLKSLADVGVILLFFFVGLQINLRDMRQHAGIALRISLTKTIPLLIGGYLFANRVLGFDSVLSAVIGVCLSVSAQAVSADVLEELGMLRTRIGKLMVTTGTVDDLFESILISAILVIINATTAKLGIIILLRDLVLFLLILILFRSLFIPFILRAIEREGSQTTLFTGSLIIVLLMAGLGEFFRIGNLIGALCAGILIRQTLLIDEKGKLWEEHSIAKMIHIIGFGFLIPIFFLWAGLSVNLSTITQHVPLLLWITAIAFTGLIGGSMIGAHASGFTWREGWTIGWGLNAKGDVELAVATLALNAKILTIEIYSVIILMALITTIVSPIVFRRLLEQIKRKA